MSIANLSFAVAEQYRNGVCLYLNADGTPKAITKPKQKGELWTTNIQGGKLRGKFEEILLDKLIDYYAISVQSENFKDLFDEAMSIKKGKKTPNTIKKNLADYNRLVTQDLADMNIKKIDKVWLDKYTVQLFKKASMVGSPLNEMAYRSYIGILNIDLVSYGVLSNIVKFRQTKSPESSKLKALS